MDNIAKLKFTLLTLFGLLLTGALMVLVARGEGSELVLRIMIAGFTIVTYWVYLWKTFQDTKNGFISTDERIHLQAQRAAARALWMSLYMIIFIGAFIRNFEDINTSQLLSYIAMGMLTLFLANLGAIRVKEAS